MNDNEMVYNEKGGMSSVWIICIMIKLTERNAWDILWIYKWCWCQFKTK